MSDGFMDMIQNQQALGVEDSKLSKAKIDERE